MICILTISRGRCDQGNYRPQTVTFVITNDWLVGVVIFKMCNNNNKTEQKIFSPLISPNDIIMMFYQLVHFRWGL